MSDLLKCVSSYSPPLAIPMGDIISNAIRQVWISTVFSVNSCFVSMQQIQVKWSVNTWIVFYKYEPARKIMTQILITAEKLGRREYFRFLPEKRI